MCIFTCKKTIALIMALAVTCTNTIFSTKVLAGDSLPPAGDAKLELNQPKVSGYRVLDIKEWSPESDDFSDLLRAQVPLQKRNTPFSKTQANPQLSSQTELFNLNGDYGNFFFDTVPYNNQFSPYTYNFWQYTDYYGSWHGMATKDVPISLYDPQADWTQRLFEFGVLNLPNPAYTNAAHKNGVQSLACIFIPRAGQTHATLLEKDSNGEFIVGKKLIEMAKYYGYDGYFINQEDKIPVEHVQPYKEFTKYLMDKGIYIQWYDAIDPQTGKVIYEPKFTERNSEFLYDSKMGLVNNSMFMNYNWNQEKGGSETDHSTDQTNIFESISLAKKLSIDPLKTLFFGVEAVKGGFGGTHNSTKNMDVILDNKTGNPLTSIALFTPDFVFSSLDADLGDPDQNRRSEKDYQHMIFERERMWYTGPSQDVKDTGEKPGFSRPDIGLSDASEWGGVSKYISERSVIDGNVFVSDFNTGHGLEYYKEGKVINSNEWSNINIQSILPTWQWWLDTQGTRLDVDFDYGRNYNNGRFNYRPIGGYNGGSSLVVNGNLDKSSFLRLFKSDILVGNESKFDIVYNKVSNTDTSVLKLGLIFKDDPDNTVYIDVPNSSINTKEWVSETIDLAPYSGRTIATIGLAFDPGTSVINDYQINIGEVKITDGKSNKPNVPRGFKVEKSISTTGEIILAWDKVPYDQVNQYNIYLEDNNGENIYLGGIYDEKFYVKSTYGKQNFKLKLTAVGKDGSESDPAVLDYNSSTKVSNIKVLEKSYGGNNNVLQNSTTGFMDISWTNAPTNKGYEVEVSFLYSDKKEVYKKSVGQNVNSTSIVVPIADGSRYTISIKSKDEKGNLYEGINHNGRLRDVYSAPYDGDAKVVDGLLELDVPSSNDWWKIYLTINGLEHIWKINGEDFNYGIRGKSEINNIDIDSNFGNVAIVLEDYSGNLSDPVVINYGLNKSQTIGSNEFPNPILLDYVKQNIGDTFDKLFSFKGELDLSGLNITNYTGLHLIPASYVKLGGYLLESNYDLRLHPNIEKISFEGSDKLKYIVSGSLSAAFKLKEIDITSCSSLELLDLKNLSLEKITYADANSYPKLISLNISGSKFDLSESTPEKKLVEKIKTQVVEGAFIETNGSILFNIAKNADILSSNFKNPERLLDNNYETYTSATGNGNITFDLKDVYDIRELHLINYSSVYGTSSFEVHTSENGVDYNLLTSAISSNLVIHKYKVENDIKARFFKFISSASFSKGSHMKEIMVYTYPKVKYMSEVKYNNQSPRVISEIAPTLQVEYNTGVFDARDIFREGKTVRGTDIKSIKDESFLNPDYDIVNSKISNNSILLIEDSKGQSVLNIIDTSIKGNYKADLISFNSDNYKGHIVNSINIEVTENINNPDPPVNKVSVLENKEFGIKVEGIDGTYFDEGTILDIMDLSSDIIKYKELIEKSYPESTTFQLYDIKLKLNGTYVQPGGRIKITFYSNEYLKKYSDIKGINISNNNEIKLFDTSYDDKGGVYFQTDHLSIYGMAGKISESNNPGNSENNPTTSDNLHKIILFLILSVISATYIYIILRDRKRSIF